MTKKTRNAIILIALAIVALALLSLFFKKSPPDIEKKPVAPETPVEEPVPPKVTAPPKTRPQVKKKPSKTQVKPVNKDTGTWEDNLRESLKRQGGPGLQNIRINKVDSFIWEQDGLPLQVESLIVTTQNLKKEETTFRVLVDSETGKILKNWDQPVFDPVNPRDGFRLKLDPRYHQD